MAQHLKDNHTDLANDSQIEDITAVQDTDGKALPQAETDNLQAESQGDSIYESEGYHVKLSNFEGPLDLLLYLIKEAKIDIKDVFVSKVTDQYLMYMQGIDELDLEKASEFLSIAATLLEIKSNSLLPKIEDVFDEGEDPAKKMIRQLEEYKMLKEGADKLKVLENCNRFYKIPDDSVYNVKVVLKDMTLDGLLDAFSKLMTKVSQKQHDISQPKEIVRDPFTVDEKISYITEVLSFKRSMVFSQLFDDASTKGELITTFLALLELTRRQFVKVQQGGIYQEIMLTLAQAEETLVG